MQPIPLMDQTIPASRPTRQTLLILLRDQAQEMITGMVDFMTDPAHTQESA
jgi:hypothetical protein